MTEDDEFAEFVSARWLRLVRAGVALGCSLHEAEDLAQATLLKCFPGLPSNGPTTRLVIQPPRKPPDCGRTCSSSTVQLSTCAAITAAAPAIGSKPFAGMEIGPRGAGRDQVPDK